MIAFGAIRLAGPAPEIIGFTPMINTPMSKCHSCASDAQALEPRQGNLTGAFDFLGAEKISVILLPKKSGE
jgi:hypothetical protein